MLVVVLVLESKALYCNGCNSVVKVTVKPADEEAAQYREKHEKKDVHLPEPRADNSACACSDCLVYTEFTRLGQPKLFYGKKVRGPSRRVIRRSRANLLFLM